MMSETAVHNAESSYFMKCVQRFENCCKKLNDLKENQDNTLNPI